MTVTIPHVADPEQAESIALSFFPEWTKDDLVFDDQGNGTTNIYAERLVPKRSYWTDLIGSALTAHYGNLGFVSHGDVHCIFDCLKRVDDYSAKQLLLHEEDNGFIMIPASQQIVQLMLAHLSQESQEEVKRQWKKNAPPMNTFLALTSVENNIKFVCVSSSAESRPKWQHQIELPTFSVYSLSFYSFTVCLSP
ncbi:hypothetical protein DAPPUDRAFT_335538 [Daphnia pulex]|uniref:Uncharacterized protein n=1 Tax=Daphnia pulex TaxID=6669 RepID=E9HY06_DAPPU|nr:hypothetical protein DAPPUDRAFT_335538 [Daphnia pulex]|eukprot:EFX63372.1 hypothetical protein DAPPUDRAFT_335538 [Daphnia pulex]